MKPSQVSQAVKDCFKTRGILIDWEYVPLLSELVIIVGVVPWNILPQMFLTGYLIFVFEKRDAKKHGNETGVIALVSDFFSLVQEIEI